MMNSPHDWGMWRSSKEDPCQEEAGWPLGKMVVVVVVVVVVVMSFGASRTRFSWLPINGFL